MDWVVILGYVASGAVFVTFWMKTFVPLRLIAIIGNALYLVYGIYADLGNIVLLHGSLLPLNMLRLYQAVQLRNKIHDMAHADFDPRSLVPFMSKLKRAKGDVLFGRGDDARDIYYLVAGRVRIDDLGIEIGPGHMIGEIAMFAPDKTRTQTVHCIEDCELMRITEEKALQLYADNPEFGLYLTKMMVARLLSNNAAAEEPAAA